MARRNRPRSKIGPPAKPSGGSTRSPARLTLLTACGLGAAACAVTAYFAYARASDQVVAATPAVQASLAASRSSAKRDSTAIVPKSLDELLSLPAGDLAKVDIALMNLLCAQGLPGSENLDIPATLRTLDEWAARIKAETDKYYPRFLRNPAENNNSEADFRMLTLISVLQLDLGVKYSPNRIGDYQRPDCDLRNSQDGFIHGMVNSDNGGTCASLPVSSAVAWVIR